jgi:hypothetical protein
MYITIGYKRDVEGTAHSFLVKDSTYDSIIKEFGTLGAYFESMVSEPFKTFVVR